MSPFQVTSRPSYFFHLRIACVLILNDSIKMGNKVVDRAVKHQEVRGIGAEQADDWQKVDGHGAQNMTFANNRTFSYSTKL